LERAFARIKRKATEREGRKKGNANWNQHVKNRVLVESQNLSDAVAGVIVKFKHVYCTKDRMSSVQYCLTQLMK
jgi:hypothetical protein